MRQDSGKGTVTCIPELIKIYILTRRERKDKAGPGDARMGVYRWGFRVEIPPNEFGQNFSVIKA